MTAASRRRKRVKQNHELPIKNWRFITPTRDEVLIPGATLKDAKTAFQEKFGYWPEKGQNHEHPETSTSKAG